MDASVNSLVKKVCTVMMNESHGGTERATG